MKTIRSGNMWIRPDKRNEYHAKEEDAQATNLVTIAMTPRCPTEIRRSVRIPEH